MIDEQDFKEFKQYMQRQYKQYKVVIVHSEVEDADHVIAFMTIDDKEYALGVQILESPDYGMLEDLFISNIKNTERFYARRKTDQIQTGNVPNCS